VIDPETVDVELEEESGEPDVLVIDHRDAGEPEVPALLARSNGSTIMVGGSLEDEATMELLRERLDHLVGDEPELDEDHLLVTTAKLLASNAGDSVFGLEKYLAWGVTVHELELSSYQAKRVAIDAATDYATEVGANRALRRRIEAVADELLMNALYDAPAVSRGEDARPAEQALSGELADPVRIRFACDGRRFALSVEDRHGALEKRAILDNVSRARRERGAPLFRDVGGAGLGLYYVLSYASRFIANVERGARTEVICLFDLGLKASQLGNCARSLDVFSVH
jgi:hypothetical protein